MHRNHKSILDAIGNTPMVELDFGVEPKFMAKLEYLNPGGSIKDRPHQDSRSEHAFI